MPDGLYFINNLTRYIGQTVTIFTTSGGQSGMGFTGVLASVNANFVRLITQIGPAPGCALGNSCDCNETLSNGTTTGIGSNSSRPPFYGYNLGSIVDIPIDRIASFVHNSLGSGF